MGKTLEHKESQSFEEFPNLEYIVLDVKKRLAQEKITPENPDYAKLLDTTIRLILLKEKFGVLKPGQSSEEKREWFNRIKEELAPAEVAKDWKVTSAHRQQLNEENRAGQTYKESGLE